MKELDFSLFKPFHQIPSCTPVKCHICEQNNATYYYELDPGHYYIMCSDCLKTERSEQESRKKKNKRIAFDFTPSAYEKLDKLVEITNASSKASVVQTALSLYLNYLKRIQNGYEVHYIKDGQSSTVEFIFPE
jgi:hypothetical protein